MLKVIGQVDDEAAKEGGHQAMEGHRGQMKRHWRGPKDPRADEEEEVDQRSPEPTDMQGEEVARV